MNRNIILRGIRTNILFSTIFLLTFIFCALLPMFAFHEDDSHESGNASVSEQGAGKFQHFMPVSLVTMGYGTILAMIIGATILGGEENDNTIEYLLSNPISRREIVFSKLAALFVCMVCANILITAATCIFIILFKYPLPITWSLAALCVHHFLLMLTMAMVGFFISLFLTKTKVLVGISIACALVESMVYVLNGDVLIVRWVKIINPFNWVNFEAILSGQMEIIAVVLLSAIPLCSGIISTMLYQRKDIAV